MRAHRLQLRCPPGPGVLFWREPTGRDVELLESNDTSAAIDFLDRILLERPGAVVGPGQAATLATADRDRLMARVLALMFGPRIQTTLACAACSSPFDLEFTIDELEEALWKAPAPQHDRRDDGTYALVDGRRFRLPTGDDELAIASADPDQGVAQLVDRCVIEGTADDELILAMERIAPSLDETIQTRCAECDTPASVRFVLQSWLLELLLREQRHLAVDMHLLASTYSWSPGEILDLSRSTRQRLAGFVRSERSRTRELS